MLKIHRLFQKESTNFVLQKYNIYTMTIKNIDEMIEFLQQTKAEMIKNGHLSKLEIDRCKSNLIKWYDLFLSDPIIHTFESNITDTASVKADIEIQHIEQKQATTTQMASEPTPYTDILDKQPAQMPPSIIESTSKPADTISFSIGTNVEEVIQTNKTRDVSEQIQQGINEQYADKALLNERFKSTSNIADKINASEKRFAELIDLNKRLLYVDILFNGNTDLFNQVVQHIDQYKNADEAIRFLDYNKDKLQINDKKESVYLNFKELVYKKFV